MSKSNPHSVRHHNGSKPGQEDVEAFERYRALLFSIAYRMLGSVSEAEDIVQETYLRFHRTLADGTDIESPKAFLTTVTTRLAIDAVRAARARHEVYVGPWLPEPLVTAIDADPSAHAEVDESLSLAFLVLLRTLSPVERAVFVLREALGYDYAEIADVVQKSEQNCRQIFARARKRVDAGTPRFEASQSDQRELATRFFQALSAGEVGRLVDFLAENATFYGDGGGKAHAYSQPIVGRERMARLLTNLFTSARRFAIGLRQVMVNGQSGVMLLDTRGAVISVMALEIADGAIQAVRSIVNPDKLDHLGLPVSDLLVKGGQPDA